MSKKNKKRQRPPSEAKSPSAPPAEVAVAAPSPQPDSGWRSVLAEPVALGLALFVVLRPLRDGLTFPGFNAYYAAGVIAIAALWCARTLIRGESIRYPVPLALLGGFLLMAYLTGLNSISYDPTHRGLQYVAMYVLVFVLASNGLRTPRAINILLIGICAAWLFCAVWAIFHYFVMLRGMRQILTDNPRLFAFYFGEGPVSPELKNRLESNRAFGTFLFPNALGAYLILGLPVVCASAWHVLREWPSTREQGTPSPHPMQNWFTIATFFSIGTFVLATLYFANDFIGTSRPGGEPPISGAYRPFLFFLPVSMLVAGAAAWVMNRGGPRALGRVFAVLGAPAAVLANLAALWLSYSRGATAALLLAGVVTALVLYAGRWPIRGARTAAALLFIAHVLISTAGMAQEEIEGYRVPEMQPSDLGYSGAKFLRDQEDLSKLDIEGAQRELDDLASLDSMRARLTYWQVGLRMAFANLWTGVGLGNFKQAFLQHQFLGAGDVETAHNDFLQYFCETGLPGGALFLAFWVYFGVWGGRRVRMEPDAVARRWLAAIYLGTLAFAIHAIVDFNFQNPGIASLAFLFAGLFYAKCAQTEPAESAPRVAARPVVRGVAVACIALTVLLTASVVRVFLFDFGVTYGKVGYRLYYVGDKKALGSPREVATKFLTELTNAPAGAKTPPFMTVRSARLVIPDLADLETIGVFGVRLPENPNSMRRLGPGEPVTDETFLFVTNPQRAVRLTTKNSEAIIEELEDLDAVYPHDPEVASELFRWYELLFNHAQDGPAKTRFAAEAERWARASTERSPKVAWWWLNYAKALWMRGSIERGPQGVAYYFTGLDYYKHAHELFPVSGLIAYQYAQALQQLGEALVKQNRQDDGQRLIRESQAMFQEAHLLANYRELVR